VCSRLLVLAILVLTACQPVPRPFEAGRETPNALLQLSDTSGVTVLPVADAPPATARKLAEEMAASLIARNVPAFVTGGNRSSLLLSGEVIDPGRDAKIVWTLYDSTGEELARHDQIIEGTPIDRWAAADPELMAQLAGEAAPAIAVFIQGEAVPEVLVPPIFVGAVSGGKDVDTIRLETALRQALRQQGARLASLPSPETLVASATVQITPLSDARSEVAITWAIRDPYGTEIGKIDQASPFPREALATEWGNISRQAGIAAAAGIVELVSQIDWSQGFIPQDPKTRPARQSDAPGLIPRG